MVGTPTTVFVTDSEHYGSYSTNSGASWSPLAALPSIIPASGLGGDIIAYSNSNAVWNVNDNGGPYCVTGGTLTGTPTWGACTLPGGQTTAGGGWSSGNNEIPSHHLAADYVATSTYCLYNSGGGSNAAGLYTSTNGTSFSFVVGSGHFDTSNDAAIMFAVPGQTGNFFLTEPPNVHGTLPDTSKHLWRTTTGCGGTWTQVPNVESLFCFSFGAAKPGNSYPSLYAFGWASDDGGSTYNYGAWRSDNISAGTPTWTKIGDGYPNGNFDYLIACPADQNNYGTIYAAYAGSGFYYGKLNFLLNRDLAPASNDNTPAWLEKVA
jgi:hypothetical protein